MDRKKLFKSIFQEYTRRKPSNQELREILSYEIGYKDGTDIVAAELLQRSPDQDDLIEVFVSAGSTEIEDQAGLLLLQIGDEVGLAIASGCSPKISHEACRKLREMESWNFDLNLLPCCISGALPEDAEYFAKKWLSLEDPEDSLDELIAMRDCLPEGNVRTLIQARIDKFSKEEIFDLLVNY